MAKLVGFPTSNSTFTYQKGVKNTSLLDFLISKGIMDSHSLHKISHSFQKMVPSERILFVAKVDVLPSHEVKPT
jgi:hypothetical protein